MVLLQILPRHPASTLPQRDHAGQDTLVGNQVERHASGTILKFVNIFNGTGVLRRTTSAAPRGPLRHYTAARNRLRRGPPAKIVAVTALQRIHMANNALDHFPRRDIVRCEVLGTRAEDVP